MKDIYSDKNSEYLLMTDSWHSEDSEWKADQISKMMQKHNITPQNIVEVGCGAGQVLINLDKIIANPSIKYEGFDIASDAISLAQEFAYDNINFYHDDFTKSHSKKYDMLLMIDVFEHVPDYLGFIERCKDAAQYKIYHIPLDIHLNSILRKQLVPTRQKVGHLHYFTKETAIATITDTGQNIIDYYYTNSASAVPRSSVKTNIANFLRRTLFYMFPELTVKLLGGYSLLVLAE